MPILQSGIDCPLPREDHGVHVGLMHLYAQLTICPSFHSSDSDAISQKQFVRISSYYYIYINIMYGQGMMPVFFKC